MKDKKDLRIVFMGTPEFAVAQLDELIKRGYDISAVVTVPDKPAGRGKKLTPSAVKTYASEHGLDVLQPEKLRDDAFLKRLGEINADIFVVVAFRMLPKAVWAMPAMGTFNLHGSMLPDYRGAAPINHAIINGETRTGLTTFMLDENIDTGGILLQREAEIGPDDDFGSMYNKLMEMGRELTIDTVEMIRTGNAAPRPQAVPQVEKPAPKIFKENTLIRWQNTAENVHNMVRGLSPVPAAYTLLWHDGKDIPVKIYSTALTGVPSDGGFGSFKVENKRLFAGCGDFLLEIKELKPEGKKRMAAADFLNGFRLAGDERFL